MPITQNRGLVARGSIQVDLQRLQSDRRLVLREAKAMSDGIKSSFRGSASAVNTFNQSIESTAARLGKLRGEITAIGAASSGITFFGLKAADNLRNLEIRFRSIEGSQERGLALMEEIAEAAQAVNLPVRDTQQEFAGLIPTIRQAGGEVNDYINLTARLLALRPDRNVGDAIFSIREALVSGGNAEGFLSLGDRFDLDRRKLQALTLETGNFAEALDIVLNEQGITTATIEEFSNSLGTATTRLRDAATRGLEKAFLPQLDSAANVINSVTDVIDNLPDGLLRFAGGAITATAATSGLALGLSQVLDTYGKLKSQGFFEIGNLRRAALGAAAIGIALNADQIATSIVQQIGNITNNQRLQEQDLGQTRNTLKQTGIIIVTGILEAGRAFVKALVTITTPLRTIPQQIELFKARFIVATGELILTLGNLIKNIGGFLPGSGLTEQGNEVIAVGQATLDEGQQRLVNAQQAIQGTQQAVLDSVDVMFDSFITNMLIGYGAIEEGANDVNSTASAEFDGVENTASGVLESVEHKIERVTQVIRERLQDIDQAIQFRAELNKLERDGTVEQIEGRIAGLEDERAAIQELLPELEALASKNDEAAESLREYQRRLGDIDSQIDQLSGIAPQVAQNQLNALTEQFNQDISELEGQRSQQLTELASKVQSELNELDQDLAEQFSDARKEEIEAVEEFQDEQREIEQEHQERLLEIQRRSKEEIADAAGRLDAAAVRAAIDARDKQEQDAEKRYENEQERNDERLQETREKLAEERREILNNYARRRADIIAAGNAERLAIQQKYQQDINARVQAFNTEAQVFQQYLNQRLQGQRAALNAELSAQNAGYNAMIQGAAAFANRLRGIASGLQASGGFDSGGSKGSATSLPAVGGVGAGSFGSTTTSTPTSGSLSGGLSGGASATGRPTGGASGAVRFNTGGIANFSGSGAALAFVDKKERVLTPQQTSSFDRLVNAITGTNGSGQDLRNISVDVTGADSVEDMIASITRQVIGQLFERQLKGAS